MTRKIDRRRPSRQRLAVWEHMLVIWRSLPAERRMAWAMRAGSAGVGPALFERLAAWDQAHPPLAELSPAPEALFGSSGVSLHTLATARSRERRQQYESLPVEQVTPWMGAAERRRIARSAERRLLARPATPAMRRVCAWCSAVLTAGDPGAEVTHTVCDRCLAAESAGWAA